MPAPAITGGALSDLPGWAGHDPAPALAALARQDDNLGRAARAATDARTFFAATFAAGAALPGHFTGYFEPELDGAGTPSPDFPVPLHALPPGGCTLPRAEVDAALAGHEIVWLRDEVDRFFLQVQGSGRVRLAGGGTLRVGHVARNGHPYRSIGKILIERGIFGPDITAEALKAWLRADPARGRAVMAENPSYVFFRALDTDPADGPPGTLGVPVTPGATIAVDPDHCPLGSPVWIETEGFTGICIAQDTGSAIKGAGRADLFFGTGPQAGVAAGRLNHPGRFVPLVPR